VVGNHSYSHRATRGWTEKAIAEEIAHTQALLEAQTGRRPALYRPPWLIRTSATYRALSSHGMQPVSGEFCHALEPWQPASRSMARRALAKAQDGAIIIFHDGYDDLGAPRGRTVAAVEEVVDALLDSGVELVGVDQLLGTSAYLPV
jgi:peptidoglycan/xylan/chitin deacetylase (PgdA/CDA1 family)